MAFLAHKRVPLSLIPPQRPRASMDIIRLVDVDVITAQLH
jgi:hypothetical protein